MNSLYIERKKQVNLYNGLFKRFSDKSLEYQINKVCKTGFDKPRCQKIFTTVITGIFYTLSLYLPETVNRRNTINKFIKVEPMTNVFILPVRNEHIKDIITFCYYMQDHTFGTFKNAFLAQLLFDLIHS